MWMTSNFPARLRSLILLLICLASGMAVLSCSGAMGAKIPPDAARPSQTTGQRPPSRDYSNQRTPVELKSVVVRRLDAALEKLAGPGFLRTATEPLAIEVQTQQPLGDLSRTSSPVIILNGEKFPDTWAVGQNKLVAFLPDRRRIKETNTVAAAWLGNEEQSMTKSPLTFKSEDVKR